MRALLVAAVLLGLTLAVERLLHVGLRDLFARKARLAFRLLALHAIVTAGVLLSLDRETRHALPGWLTATTTLPATAFGVSLIGLLLSSPWWLPAGLLLRRAAAPRPPPGAELSAPGAQEPEKIEPRLPAPAPLAALPAGPPVPPALAKLPDAAPPGRLITRRNLLHAAAVAPPLALFSAGPLGMISTEGFPDPFVRRLELTFPSLPAALDGTKLVQVSDVHIGQFISGPRLAAALELARAEQPDLFLVTGDLIDDLGQLDETVEALSLVRPRFGSFACVGNHEHYAGLPRIRRALARSPVQLLEDEAVKLTLPGGTLEVSGVDYAFERFRPGGREPTTFESHAERALVERGTGGDFRLHLCHHPHGFDAAAERGADLTLSGHTHGGQLGLGSRSLIGGVYRYMRGLYELGPRRLFVNSGLGHWLPVRVGCPTEVAVITLRRGPAGQV